jgi:hypothetical protein
MYVVLRTVPILYLQYAGEFSVSPQDRAMLHVKITITHIHFCRIYTEYETRRMTILILEVPAN